MLPVHTIVIEDNPAEEDAKAFSLGLTRGLKMAVEYWNRKILRRHFQAGARARYGYAARSRKYEQRKARLYGHKVPLVFSGESRRQLLSRYAPATSRKSVSRHAAAVKLLAPSYFFKFHKGSQADKTQETLATTEDEYSEMLAVVRSQIDETLARARKRRRKA